MRAVTHGTADRVDADIEPPAAGPGRPALVMMNQSAPWTRTKPASGAAAGGGDVAAEARRELDGECADAARAPLYRLLLAAIRKLVIRMATEIPALGQRRGLGELFRLGHPIAASTVWQILHAAGIDPVPRRKARRGSSSWPRRPGIIAVDFARVDTLLLRRLYALIVIEHGTRGGHLASVTAHAKC